MATRNSVHLSRWLASPHVALTMNDIIKGVRRSKRFRSVLVVSWFAVAASILRPIACDSLGNEWNEPQPSKESTGLAD